MDVLLIDWRFEAFLENSNLFGVLGPVLAVAERVRALNAWTLRPGERSVRAVREEERD